MTKYDKYLFWDRVFGWSVKFKQDWLPIHGVYYTRNMRCVLDDPDMPF